MTEQVSIWRWAVTDDLEPLFSKALGAGDAGFVALNAQIAQSDMPAETIDDLEARAREKFAGMDLPTDVMETMMEGFAAMMAEAREDAADETDQDSNARPGLALASSHMFYDDPYASLEYPEIDAQVEALIHTYRRAITEAVGHAGQSLAAFLALSEEQFFSEDVFDVLLAAELADVAWLWVQGQEVFFLSQWQDDKELPIDVEFARVPLAELEAVKAALT